jgi:hypothetical protein
MLNSTSLDAMIRCACAFLFTNFFTVTLLHTQIMNEAGIRLPLPGARAAGLADAYAAEVSDAAVMYWNPASAPFLDHSAVILDHYHESQTGVMNDVVATSVHVTDEDAITLGGDLSHLGYLASSRSSGLRAIQSGLHLGYARILYPGVSVGLTATANYIDLQENRRWTSSWMAGLTYFPSPEISYGLVFRDVVHGAQVEQSSVAVREELPRRLEMGISMRYPVSRARRIVTISLGNEKFFGESGLLYKGGVELYPIPFLALRWGYLAGPDIAEPRYGLGVRTEAVQLDFAISPKRDDVQFQQVTLSVSLK